MKFEEALKLMREGKKFKGHYGTGEYFYVDKDGLFWYFSDADGKIHPGLDYLRCDDFSSNYDWEEYKEPILDEVEKRYLENVIRPFRNRANTITIRKHRNFDRECIELRIFSLKWVIQESMFFPSFEEGTMYKGMEANRAYKLEELGLFEEEEDK